MEQFAADPRAALMHWDTHAFSGGLSCAKLAGGSNSADPTNTNATRQARHIILFLLKTR
jgi:hypothetical protein